MRKHRLVLVVVALFAAASAASASAINSPRVFNLLDVSVAEQQLNGFAFDRPPQGGEQFAFVDALYRWKGTGRGARVGRVQGMGTFITGFGPNFSRRPTVLFVAQAYLPGGTVLIQGYGKINPRGPSKFTFPVVGGTGIYDNVRGYIKVRDLGNGESGASNIQFHLLP